MSLNFPSLFSGFSDITNETYEFASYPNDYGTTSPITNLGVSANRKDLDYINVEKAWDLTTGFNLLTGDRVKIGISDSRINTTDADFVGKVSLVNPFFTQSQPYQNPDSYGFYGHGTNIAGIAAARGNNAHGSVGICYDCDIVGTAAFSYTNLVLLADAGVRVINMSWTGPPSNTNQNIINELALDRNVVLVAAAGNTPSYQTDEDHICNSSARGVQYLYPASFDNVISVSAISHKYPKTGLTNSSASYCCTSSLYPIHYSIEDGFNDTSNATNPNNPISIIHSGYPTSCGTAPNGFVLTHTSNPKVDILAPTYDCFRFDLFTELGQINYTGAGTSQSAPKVAAVAALMLSVNDCLKPREVECILKLTSKDVENIPINQLFVGQIGAGALNSGDAVEFVNESKKVDGNAIIKDHIFNRFDYNLSNINNNLTIQNVTFRDECKSDFVAKNQIKLLPNTRLIPNNNGSTHLSINTNIVVTCNISERKAIKVSESKEIVKSNIVLYPNPNTGSFYLYNLNKENFGNQEIKLDVYDINGRNLYNKKISNEDIPTCQIDLSYLSTGIYIVRLTNSFHSEDFKFIKN